MKNLRNQLLLTLLALVLCTAFSYAQGFQGTATYQSAANAGKEPTFKIQGEGITPEMEEKLAQAIKKQNQKEFTLNFNLSESNWKEVASLGNGPSAASGGVSGISIRMSVSGDGALKYRNIAENLYLEETNLMSKPFLVKDELKNFEWELTNETKKIGEYTVQKAQYTKVTIRKMMTFGNGVAEGDGEPKVITDSVKVEAWFTSQIPVSHGPDDYWGLPGLILELKDGRKTYLCTKVILNPEDGVEIKKPRKGKKVTREEYTEIQMEKLKEMQEKYSSGGNGVMFKSGGN